MKVLELFSGTRSIGKYCDSKGWECVSVDSDPRCETNVCQDVLEWDYARTFPVGYFDIIWASPPCEHYSTARNMVKNFSPPDLVLADSLVNKTLDIIQHFQPAVWIIENPAWGEMRNRPMMHGIPDVVVSYCKYGMLYQKHTRLWTNLEDFQPRMCRFDCDNLDPTGRFHLAKVATNLKESKPGQQRVRGKNSLHRIPPDLIEALFDCARNQ